MKILKDVLVFNRKVEPITCDFCKGTGKITPSKMSGGTTCFCIMVGLVFLFSLLDLFGSTPNYYIDVPFLIISGIFGIISMKEYNKQTKQPNEKESK